MGYTGGQAGHNLSQPLIIARADIPTHVVPPPTTRQRERCVLVRGGQMGERELFVLSPGKIPQTLG